MSSRSHAVAAGAPSGGATRARRRPARRPAPRTGGSRIRWDRLGRIVLTVVILVLIASYVGPAIDLFKTHQAASSAKAELREIQRENGALKARIEHISSDQVLNREARRQGMIVSGEQAYVVNGLNR